MKKVYRVAIVREGTLIPLIYTVKKVNTLNPACFIMVGIENQQSIGWNEDRTILVPWSTILTVDVQEKDVTE